jgi:chromosome segregation ATPase
MSARLTSGQLLQRIANLEAQLKVQRRDFFDSQKENASLRDELAQAEEARDQLSQALQVRDTQLAQVTAEAEVSIAECERLTARVVELEARA